DLEDNKVHLFIENSKPEIPVRHSGKKSGGIGLVNVKRRLKLLYPEQYRLKIEERPGSYQVDLTLSLDWS
ncbi:MAG: sensor histidine kinase YesM, partial [Saprospiraceae bacterium]